MAGEGKITIEYGARLNELEGGGWLPAIWCNGRRFGSTWGARGLDRDGATRAARDTALHEATRYIGDWDLAVNPRKEEI